MCAVKGPGSKKGKKKEGVGGWSKSKVFKVKDGGVS